MSNECVKRTTAGRFQDAVNGRLSCSLGLLLLVSLGSVAQLHAARTTKLTVTQDGVPVNLRRGMTFNSGKLGTFEVALRTSDGKPVAGGTIMSRLEDQPSSNNIIMLRQSTDENGFVIVQVPVPRRYVLEQVLGLRLPKRIRVVIEFKGTRKLRGTSVRLPVSVLASDY